MADPKSDKINTKFKCNALLKLILSYRLLFGFYYHLSSSKALRFTARLYCVIFTCVISTFIYELFIRYSITFITKFYFFLLILEINLQILFSLFTSEAPVISFASNSYSIIALNQLSKSPPSCYVTPVLVLISYSLTSISTYLIYLTFGKNHLMKDFFSHIIPTALIFSSRLTSLYIMEMYKKTMLILKMSVTESFFDKAQSDREKIAHVKKFLNVYIELSHTLNKTLYIVKYQVSKMLSNS